MSTSGNTSPTLVRRALGRRLRAMRLTAGKTVEDVIFTGILSRSKLHRIESGRTVVKQGDVLALARLYGADLAKIDDLLAMADATKGSGFQEQYGSRAVSQSLGLYAELEGVAERICDYSTELLHGLLQTPAYARTILSADSSPQDVVEQRVAFRIERQRRWFDRPETGRIETIIPAGVLNLVVGSPAVMKEQIAHLRAVDEGGAARISVLPATGGVHRAMMGSFVLMEFHDPDDPSAVYVEDLLGGRYIDRPADVAQYRQAFEEIQCKALPLEEWLQ